MKDFGHVTLVKGERSVLADMAAKYLIEKDNFMKREEAFNIIKNAFEKQKFAEALSGSGSCNGSFLQNILMKIPICGHLPDFFMILITKAQ